jgi:hypothetical protein
VDFFVSNKRPIKCKEEFAFGKCALCCEYNNVTQSGKHFFCINCLTDKKIINKITLLCKYDSGEAKSAKNYFKKVKELQRATK